VGKQCQTPFPCQAEYRVEGVLDLVHGVICGPITPMTHSGNWNFILLVDDASRYRWVKMFLSKDRAAEVIKQYQAAAEAETGRRLCVFRSDKGGEFTSTEFVDHYVETGVHLQLTTPYTPQQNCVVEWRNQTVVGTARSMMKSKGLPGVF
jgi:hypothetical protein